MGRVGCCMTSFGNNNFVSEKNICELAIMCIKFVAECKEDVLSEAVTIQICRIEYSSSFNTSISARWNSTRNEKKTKELG